MAPHAANARPDPSRLAKAAEWRVRLTEAGLESCDELQRWLDEDEANVSAWRAAQEVWADLGELATAPEMLVARRDALDRARRVSRSRWQAARPSRRGLAAAAAITVLIGGVTVTGWISSQPAIYETDRGERQNVTLSDGSIVALDSATRLQVRYSKESRTLKLLSGQARFDVARDISRPFKVMANDQTIVATGTSFNIELLGGKVLVTLLEGKVAVFGGAQGQLAPERPALRMKAAIHLEAGQRLVADSAVAAPAAKVEKVDLERATAWEDGKLVFDDEPLSTVAERVSRYTAKPVMIGDGRAAALRISGVFTAGDLVTFVDTVTQYLPLDATTRGDGAVMLRSRG